MLVSIISKTKGDVFEIGERLVVDGAAFAEGDILRPHEFVKFNSVIGRLALAIGGKNEDSELVIWELVEILEIIVL